MDRAVLQDISATTKPMVSVFKEIKKYSRLSIEVRIWSMKSKKLYLLIPIKFAEKNPAAMATATNDIVRQNMQIVTAKTRGMTR